MIRLDWPLNDSPAQIIADAYTKATIECCGWLVQRGEAPLARRMRNKFMKDSGVLPKDWNACLDELIEYKSRKVDFPEMAMRELEEVRA